ncbi:hypothetical protein [Amycolatopsis sp. NPDC057786]|uniref:hypothetical protein n=1 Tax=Amycolatopsis sp. NPDC057786 TaxID=3346250 RepID=UPI0036727EDE
MTRLGLSTPDGTTLARHHLYLPPAEVSETQDSQFSRTQEARWGMTFSALATPKGKTCIAV